MFVMIMYRCPERDAGFARCGPFHSLAEIRRWARESGRTVVRIDPLKSS